MDSKSISRKGVGVRLPSLAPASQEDALSAAARELGAVLVPELCRRLRAATAALGALELRLARDPAAALGDEVLARQHEELAHALARAGYCLGVLGAGGRADLLRERRERRGLAWFAGECALAHGARLVPGEHALPPLGAAGAPGWQRALRAGWCAASAARQAREIAFEQRSDALVFRLERPLTPDRLRTARALGIAARARTLAVALS